MNVSAEVLRTHIDYTNWATNRLLAQTAALTPEELAHDFGTADKNIIQTLAHVYWADTLWLARIEGGPPPAFRPPDVTMGTMQGDWPGLQERWIAYAAGLTDDSSNAPITYSSLLGGQYTQPLWQLLLHIVNHATHHRGQVSGFMRTLGKKPDPLDLAAYYRQIPAWKS